MKLTAEQIAALDWVAADRAADQIKGACKSAMFVAPECTAILLSHVQRVADAMTVIMNALKITPPGAKP